MNTVTQAEAPGMTPEQCLKHAVLLVHFGWNPEVAVEVTAENVDAIYEKFDDEDDGLQDARGEVRGGTVETKLDRQWSRHYESKAVAAQMPDGRWVGWTYWYGGGKHGEPESMDWMEDAYFLDCHEEQKTVTVQMFTRVAA